MINLSIENGTVDSAAAAGVWFDVEQSDELARAWSFRGYSNRLRKHVDIYPLCSAARPSHAWPTGWAMFPQAVRAEPGNGGAVVGPIEAIRTDRDQLEQRVRDANRDRKVVIDEVNYLQAELKCLREERDNAKIANGVPGAAWMRGERSK